MSVQEYWNPILETLPLEKLKQLQFKKFKRILSWAYIHSKFHKALYDNAGLTPDDIRSFDDIKKIPKVEKSMMRGIQNKDPFPYGDALCVTLDEVSAFRQTSGTTGQPVYQPDTWQDWEWWSECWSFVLWAQGYRPKDRVFIPFGYNIFVAFWAGHYAAEKLGCEVVPGGVLDTQSRILKIKELNATAMMATPTYILRMADVAKNKMGINPKDLFINKITCAGEPGAGISSTKKRMEAAWGAKVYDHSGATEIGAWSYECSRQPCGMHVNEAMFLVEIEDLNTGEIIEEPGRKGKMIITALDRMAQPCIRFDSKDIIQWDSEPCECGRSFRLIRGGVLGRADDIFYNFFTVKAFFIHFIYIFIYNRCNGLFPFFGFSIAEFNNFMPKTFKIFQADPVTFIPCQAMFYYPLLVYLSDYLLQVSRYFVPLIIVHYHIKRGSICN